MKRKNSDRDNEWLPETFRRNQRITHRFPMGFTLICALLDVTPEQIIIDFADNLACGSWKREGRDKAKQHLIDYVVEHGYGQCHYSKDDIRSIFDELDSLGKLFPRDGGNVIDLYSQFRQKYWGYWFSKWFNKYRRTDPGNSP